MKKNMGKTDRIVRLLPGIIMIILAVFAVDSTVIRTILAVLGVVMLFTATTGVCLLYFPLNFKTNKSE